MVMDKMLAPAYWEAYNKCLHSPTLVNWQLFTQIRDIVKKQMHRLSADVDYQWKNINPDKQSGELLTKMFNNLTVSEAMKDQELRLHMSIICESKNAIRSPKESIVETFTFTDLEIQCALDELISELLGL